MANLKDIKLRINSVKKTQQITRAMKMVAASKMKRATSAILAVRPFAVKLQSLIGHLVADDDLVSNVYMQNRPVRTVLLVIVAADKGLCGGFNANVRKAAQAKIKDYEDAGSAVKLMTVGNKATEFASKFETEIAYHYDNIFKDLNYSDAGDIVELISEVFLKAEVDQVDVLFNRFESAISQVPTIQQMLPLQTFDTNDQMKHDYIYEPSKLELLSNLIPKHLNYQLWRALLESNASEQAARMMAMDSATNNAGEMIRNLQITYNKIRQASITTEISEIVGGAAALQD